MERGGPNLTAVRLGRGKPSCKLITVSPMLYPRKEEDAAVIKFIPENRSIR
jgi:hypothetical protein